ncbi:MAG: hypothetical protein U0441_09695 [Polyangiaceae bacterium]
MAEVYPDSEIARVFSSVTEALRIKPLAVEQLSQQTSLAVREQAPIEPSKKKALDKRGGAHPLARRLPWNVASPLCWSGPSHIISEQSRSIVTLRDLLDA